MKNIKLLKVLCLLLSLVMLTGLLTACPKPPGPTEKTITVAFDVNTSSNVTNAPDPIDVKKGDTVSEPNPSPSRNGYDFSGWYTTKTCTGNSFDFNTPIDTEDDIFYLFAKWELHIEKYTVNFNYGGKGGTNYSVEVNDGDKVALPAVADTADAFFDGWRMGSANGQLFGAETGITANITLYAKWIQAYYLTFNLNYTGAPPAQSTKYRADAIPDRPTDPADQGDMTFAGWYTEKECVNAYNFTAMTGNKDVYAKWTTIEAAKYDVVFIFNYMGAPGDETRQVVDGGIVTPPSVSSRDGYIHDGWYMEPECVNRFELTTPITSKLELYAGWVKSYSYTINYNYTGASAPIVSILRVGALIEKPQNPSRLGGYTFAFWATVAKANINADYVFDTPISADVTIYAQWLSTGVYEAEDTDFTGFVGRGSSGGAQGTTCIVEDFGGSAKASNGFFVSYLFLMDDDDQGEGDEKVHTNIQFVIYSDRDIDGISMTLRLGAEMDNYTIYGVNEPDNALDKCGKWAVIVNGEYINYGSIDLYVDEMGDRLPFADYVIGNISLKEGKNVIKLSTQNDILLQGTAVALAPTVDCMKLTTIANLTFTPKEGNYSV